MVTQWLVAALLAELMVFTFDTQAAAGS